MTGRAKRIIFLKKCQLNVKKCHPVDSFQCHPATALDSSLSFPLREGHKCVINLFDKWDLDERRSEGSSRIVSKSVIMGAQLIL
jgi:hypothetical protein